MLNSALSSNVNRRASALNTYKFDQIIEEDDEEDDESSLNKLSLPNVRRNSTQNNISLRSLNNNNNLLDSYKQDKQDKKEKMFNGKQRQPNQIKNYKAVPNWDDEQCDISEGASEGRVNDQEQIISPQIPLQFIDKVFKHQSDQIRPQSGLIAVQKKSQNFELESKVSEELLKFQQRFGLLDAASAVSGNYSVAGQS